MNRHEIDEFVSRGDDFYQDGNFDRAIDFYIRALEMDTKNPDALEGLGQAYVSLCNWERAVRIFEQLIKVESDQPSAHYLLGHALGALGQYDRAISELHIAKNLGYTNSDLYSATGYALHMKGDIERAIESYRLALEMDPDDTITMFNYGKALVAQRSYLAARLVLEDAVKSDPEDAQSWIALGEVYEDLDELDLAFHAYERALILDPGSPDARCLAAHVCLMSGRLDEAEWEYKMAASENPEDSEAWAGLGEVLIAQERYHEALSVCRKALEIDPMSVYGLSGYISACEHTGDFDEARRAVNIALEKDNNSSDLWYLLAGIEAAAEIPEQALPAYERAAKLNPADSAAHAGIGWALIELERDLALAEIHLLESVRLAPDWYYPCLQLGELYLQKNDRDTAADWFTRAYEIAPDEPEVREAFADPEVQELLNNHQ
jgi:tetratricopeptide (TPR) repeat protein